MFRNVFILALVALLGLVLAAEVPESLATEVKTYRKCPCKCYTGHKEYKAYNQCHKKRYLYHCEVSDCYHYGYYGKWCCDGTGTKPTTKPPTTTPKRPCPCKCASYHFAVKQCEYLDYCEVKKCDDHYGYHTKYECCDKHY